MAGTQRYSRPIGLAIFLVLAGGIGWFASFALIVEKIELLTDASYVPSCDFGLLVQCGKNLASWQGSLFGFPNPIIGLGGFVAPIAVGVAILGGARFSRWFWLLFSAGVAGALAFVIWLISESIFSLGTLCPWCMVAWSVTIPMFWLVILHDLRSGVIPVGYRARAFFADAYTWVPAITLASYLAIAIIAQARLDVLSYL